MRYYVCFHIENFFGQALNSDDLESMGKPLIVLRNKAVLEADFAAQTKGISPGMTERQARSILGEARFVEFDSLDLEAAQSAWLDVLTDYSDVIEPTDLNTAYVDLSSHPDPSSLPPGIAKRLWEDFGYRVRVGVGCSKWIAAVSAQTAFDEKAVSRPSEFLRFLPTDLLLPVPAECRERLKFLGYESIGKVAALPDAVLQKQFGKQASLIRMASTGRLTDPVKRLYPPDTLTERMYFAGAIEDTETLASALNGLSKDLSGKLCEKEAQASEVTLTIETEEGEFLRFSRVLTKPVQSRASCLSALNLLLNKRELKPFVSLTVRLSQVKAEKRVQQDLHHRIGRQEKASSLEATLAKLDTAMGKGTIVKASAVQASRRQEVLKQWEKALGIR